MIEIHPSKGYLNTKFRIFTDLIPGEFIQVYKLEDNKRTRKESSLMFESPNKSCIEHQFAEPGTYEIEYGQQTVLVNVEDAVKLGGSIYKDSYVFSDLQLIIVVMKDRMYFHDNKNDMEYMEFLSPDNVRQISDKCLLFESYHASSNGNSEFSIYNIDTHSTILYCLDYEIVERRWLITIMETTNDNLLELFDLDNVSSGKLQSIRCEAYNINSDYLYFYRNRRIERISWQALNEVETVVKGCHLEMFVDSFGYASIINGQLTIRSLDLENEKVLEVLNLKGRISFDENEFTAVCYKEKQKLKELTKSIESADCSYISISENIHNISVVSYDNDCYTLVKSSVLTTNCNRIEETHSITLYFNDTEIQVPISMGGNVKISALENCVLLHDSNNIIIVQKKVIKHLYEGQLYETDFRLFIEEKSSTKQIYNIDESGNVLGTIAGNFSLKYLEKFHLIEDVETKIVYTFNQKTNQFEKLSKNITNSPKVARMIFLENGFVDDNGIICIVDDEKKLLATTDTIKSFGKVIDGKQDYLYVDDGKYWLEPNATRGKTYQLFANFMDNTNYKDVLLSSDGNLLLYRDNKQMWLKDPLTGEKTAFADVRFISHVNGNRPLFKVENSHRRIRIIDPMTNQEVNNDYIVNYNFVSPDGKLYASTKLTEYTKITNKITGKEITRKEWNELKATYDNDNPRYRDNKEKENERKCKKQKFIDTNISFFNKIDKFDKKKVIEHGDLTPLFLDVHAFCRIYKRVNDERYCDIDLGSTELGFINYVSFSQDSRYVAIAGCYPWGHGEGLFVLYDLKENKELAGTCPRKAVWHTAFTPQGLVAAYDSTPNTFILDASVISEPYSSWKELPTIHGENFMAFSPDGSYMALSEQGYLPYDQRIDDTTWGHMPSTKVIVRRVKDDFSKIAVYNDLADEGIQGTNQKISTASVSFSSDNSKLMMVGKDGTIVIRNTHLDGVYYKRSGIDKNGNPCSITKMKCPW